VEIGLKALADIDTASHCVLPNHVDFNGYGLEVLRPVLDQGPVNRLTVNNPNMNYSHLFLNLWSYW